MNGLPNEEQNERQEFEKKRKMKKEMKSGSNGSVCPLGRVEFDRKPLYPRFVSVDTRQNSELRGADPTLQIELILSKNRK